ncbi:hypothetical protein CANCADRAFT_117630 [Tortispora caseinolytica NRRL Y-17796]|uniref:Serine/threonine-protein phosphatase 2A activator n=1 Tax=Tortispora caseinolytica NRRL Y-17796 TaxID=767744 RepID=A0A1E4THH5_9ASCO|nr:hypothetical protein CANCADRAFT_117630 [Tortispora caseinolytica NRRL Y-17796]
MDQWGFGVLSKKINEGPDVQKFLKSPAYKELDRLLVLFASVVHGHQCPKAASNANAAKLVNMISLMSDTLDQTPLEPGQHRFGNPGFKTFWNAIVEKRTQLVESCLSKPESEENINELSVYLVFSLGSQVRLDYGTGHELSFLAFVGGLYRLNHFELNGPDILLLFKSYLDMTQKSIIRFTLEPAGSHGVWGLDDHFHIPYILGAAQFADIHDSASDSKYPGDVPKPSSVTNSHIVNDNKEKNLFFDAISFIYTVKSGPFFAHSPMLYDISGLPSWYKIANGLIKMYRAEVLGKFPVVQHFGFGTLYQWQ